MAGWPPVIVQLAPESQRPGVTRSPRTGRASTIRRITLIAVACAALLAWPVPAYAATWTQPNITTLSGSLAKGDGAWLELPWATLWTLKGLDGLGAGFSPRSIELLENGNLLITDTANGSVWEVTYPAGQIVWRYHGSSAPAYARRLPSGDTLVVDQQADRIYAIDGAPSATELWSVNVPARVDGPNAETNIADPVHAVMLPATNTLNNADVLVADNRSCRVVALRTSDGSIAWEYARGDGGWPTHVQYLASGNVLVTYAADDQSHPGTTRGSAVVEVTPSGGTVWQYGTWGVVGSGTGQLASPAWSERLADGSTLIADTGNNRTIRVDASRRVVWQYSAANPLGLADVGLIAPRASIDGPNGSTIIADQGNARIVEIGRSLSGEVASGQIDCGLPGVRKRFSSIKPKIELPSGTGYTLVYSIDGGSFRTLSGTTLPSNAYGKLIRYRITLTSTRHDLTPRLSAVTIDYTPAPSTSGTANRGTGSSGRWTGLNTGAGAGAGTGTVQSKQSGAGYTSGGTVAVPGGLAGPLTVQRGWSMTRVGSTTLLGGKPGAAGMPTPPLGGLVLLGVVYSMGAASVPLGHVIARIFGRAPTPV